MKTTYGRNAFGQPETVTETASHQVRTSTIIYDDFDGTHPADVENAEGHPTQVVYDPRTGLMAGTVDANGPPTLWQFDALGTMRREDGPGSQDIDFHHESLVGGMIARSEPKGGIAVAATYDRLGRVVKRSWLGASGAEVTETRSYDPLTGELAESKAPTQATEVSVVRGFQYDRTGRKTKNLLGGTVVRTYDYRDRETTVVDFRTTTEKTERWVMHNAIGQVESITAVGPSPTGTGQKQIKTSYTYGPFGVLRTIVDDVGHATVMDHDRLGRLVNLIDPDTGETETKRNAFGEPREETTADLALTTFEYDRLGRLRFRRTGGKVNETIYDSKPFGLGRPGESTSYDGVRKGFTYDENGRLQTQTWTVAGADYSIGTSYDVFGHVQEVRYPQPANAQPFAVTYDYTPEGRLKSVKGPSGPRCGPPAPGTRAIKSPSSRSAHPTPWGPTASAGRTPTRRRTASGTWPRCGRVTSAWSSA